MGIDIGAVCPLELPLQPKPNPLYNSPLPGSSHPLRNIQFLYRTTLSTTTCKNIKLKLTPLTRPHISTHTWCPPTRRTNHTTSESTYIYEAESKQAMKRDDRGPSGKPLLSYLPRHKGDNNPRIIFLIVLHNNIFINNMMAKMIGLLNSDRFSHIRIRISSFRISM